MHKNISNIYVHYFVRSSQCRSDLNHTHHYKDTAIIIIIYIQVFIICDKNDIGNPNGGQSENHFTLISKHNLALQFMHIFDIVGLSGIACELLGSLEARQKRGEKWFFIVRLTEYHHSLV